MKNRWSRLPLASTFVFSSLLSWSLLCAGATYAQLAITFPVARTVFQRDNANQTYLTIVGTCPTGVDWVDCQLVSLNSGQATGWQILDGGPIQGHFRGRLLGSGGWYRLIVRAIRGGNVVASGEVQPVGVGEVFAIAGQSNGQGIRDRNAVNAVDERVVCSPHANQTDTTRLPLPFQGVSITAGTVISPRGLTAWCWGRLGDRLAARLNVPVMFFNSAWSGTAVRNWRESITADSTATSYNEYFRPGMPYGNLKRIVQDYAPLTGLRAVLWHQGEAEFYDTDPSASRYAADLTTVIQQSRIDAGFDLSWMVARASMDNNLLFNYNYTHYAPVVSAQNQVIQTVSRVYSGPDTDVLQMPRTDGVHFSDDGLRIVGDAWNDSMNDDFFRNTVPLLPAYLQSTDLRLQIQVDNAAPVLNNPVWVTMTVQNDGSYRATNVKLRSLLPGPLLFAGSETVAHKRGLVLASIPEIQPGASASVAFFAQPTQDGTYQLAAEIARTDQLDPDSRPNTSIGDGQDDLARASFRTRSGSAQVFSTPVSVNAPPLPDVAPNQPYADPNQADLSLTMALSNAALPVGRPVTVNLTIVNRGGRSSGYTQVGCLLPAGIVFVDGSGVSAEPGIVRGGVADLGAGNSATISFRVQAVQPGSARFRAQIEQSSVFDPDSTPNNGYDNGEDDTAQASLRTN